MQVRPATIHDVPAIRDIYNDAVKHSTATFDTEVKSLAELRTWFAQHDEAHPVLVADEAERVIGWGSVSAWSDRRAYEGTAEVSVYVDRSSRSGGVGTALLTELIERARRAGLHLLISRVTGDNEASTRLHRRFGFTYIGTMHEAGVKFGRYLDVHLYELILPAAETR
jgi:phosphinothricin acetyltransferase